MAEKRYLCKDKAPCTFLHAVLTDANINALKKLLSLPPNLVDCFHDITGRSSDEWFVASDPVGHRVGSGGGTAWLLSQMPEAWRGERKLILHAGGQSRRLPAYAPSGKILTPVPVFRWERGQRLSQDLLSLQLPLYEQIMERAPRSLRTMVVSGDVFIRATRPLQAVPEADVVCYGLWLNDEIAKDHGVFASRRETPAVLECMLQKPTIEQLHDVRREHYTLVDIGVWLLSDRAAEVLRQRAADPTQSCGLRQYDLYTDFGGALGTRPTVADPLVARLTVKVLPLPGGEFYHYGTTPELLSSTLAVQNIVTDQREIMHRDRKAHPSIFVQNADIRQRLTEQNANVWIENSTVGASWTLTHDNVVTGVPENDWCLTLSPGQCVDIVPWGERQFVVRTYRYNDKFAGAWQTEPLFPVVNSVDDVGAALRSLLGQGNERDDSLVARAAKVSAEDITARANLRRLTQQREALRMMNWQAIAANHAFSVFYQTDLNDAAREYAAHRLPLPAALAETEPLMTRAHDAMFRSEVLRLSDKSPRATSISSSCAEENAASPGGSCPRATSVSSSCAEKNTATPGDSSPRATSVSSSSYADTAFSLLRQGIAEAMLTERQEPRCSVYADQIVWGRSPVRIDLAGGWTDTPPYCLMEGGAVVNIAIDLNGQQPIQTYVRPSREPHIVLRSIDLGASEVITTYEELSQFCVVGSPFSIPKAALALCGFLPRYCATRYASLRQQLETFGCGIEVTLLSAIPAGSGLGTSSVLAATVLGTLSDFCALHWDKTEIGRRTLVLEQLLTTGGGWQDQFGGLLHGAKLLTTERGFSQLPTVRWLPTTVFTQPDYKACHLLYYTGITRTAKTLLAEIVRRMFLNDGPELRLLRDMRQHARDMFEAIQAGDFALTGCLVRKTWEQNQRIDAGTNPEAVRRMTEQIDDLCLGYKLPGAGGGGYMYMVAKDPEAAAAIRQRLSRSPLTPNARFVEMSLSETGLQVSRS